MSLVSILPYVIQLPSQGRHEIVRSCCMFAALFVSKKETAMPKIHTESQSRNDANRAANPRRPSYSKKRPNESNLPLKVSRNPRLATKRPLKGIRLFNHTRNDPATITICGFFPQAVLISAPYTRIRFGQLDKRGISTQCRWNRLAHLHQMKLAQMIMKCLLFSDRCGL